jgi:hypothetical protein
MARAKGDAARRRYAIDEAHAEACMGGIAMVVVEDAEDGWGYCPLAEKARLYPLARVEVTFGPDGKRVTS